MDTRRFEREFSQLYGDVYSSLQPRDRKLASLCREVPGMATENKLMLLNFAASLLEPGEIYLEVGTWKGLSILGAMHGNAEKEFYAIDDFSQFGGANEVLQRNLRKHGAGAHLTFIYGDCFSILRSPGALAGRRVGAFFYDGHHSFTSQFRALHHITRHLSDRALVVIDDTAWLHVRTATRIFVVLHPSFRLLADIPSPYNGEPRWWNGVQVYEYLRSKRPKIGRGGANRKAITAA